MTTWKNFYSAKCFLVLSFLAGGLLYLAGEVTSRRGAEITRLEAACFAELMPKVENSLEKNPNLIREDLMTALNNEFCNGEHLAIDSSKIRFKSQRELKLYVNDVTDWSQSINRLGFFLALLAVISGIPLAWRFLLARIAELRVAILGR